MDDKVVRRWLYDIIGEQRRLVLDVIKIRTKSTCVHMLFRDRAVVISRLKAPSQLLAIPRRPRIVNKRAGTLTRTLTLLPSRCVSRFCGINEYTATTKYFFVAGIAYQHNAISMKYCSGTAPTWLSHRMRLCRRATRVDRCQSVANPLSICTE
jgi:hypothetical protein